MNGHPDGPPPRRRSSSKLFLALLIGGLLMLAIRMVALPNVAGLDMIMPIVGGVLIALAIVVMVKRERDERSHMSKAERDTPEHGSPP